MADLTLSSKVLEVTERDRAGREFLAKEMDRIWDAIRGEWDPRSDRSFDEASQRVMDETDAKYCDEGKKKGDEFWIRVFCKDVGGNR